MEKAALVKQKNKKNKTNVVIELQQNEIRDQKQTVQLPKHINPEPAPSTMNVGLHLSF